MYSLYSICASEGPGGFLDLNALDPGLSLIAGVTKLLVHDGRIFRYLLNLTSLAAVLVLGLLSLGCEGVLTALEGVSVKCGILKLTLTVSSNSVD